jgi:hypothetical protein
MSERLAGGQISPRRTALETLFMTEPDGAFLNPGGCENFGYPGCDRLLEIFVDFLNAAHKLIKRIEPACATRKLRADGNQTQNCILKRFCRISRF